MKRENNNNYFPHGDRPEIAFNENNNNNNNHGTQQNEQVFSPFFK